MKKLNKILFTLITVLLIHSLSFSQWIQQTSGTSTALLDIEYISPVNGGIAAACGLNGNIYRTSNGGTNWIQITTSISSQLTDIEFTDINTGYSAGSNGVIIKTTNGGINWVQLSSGSTAGFNCMHFVNSSTGFICGGTTTTAEILKTTNGGVNWNPNTFTTQANLLQSIFFIDALTGWAMGYNQTSFIGSILKTTNGGANWQEIFVSPGAVAFFDMIMSSSSTGFISGGGTINRTTNGGSNFNTVFEPGDTPLDFELINSLIVYAVGGSSTISKTTNGGLNWFNQASPVSGRTFRSISMIGDTGFICGIAGTILKTTNGGQVPTGLIISSNEIPKNYSLSQNFPNPFNPATKIVFNIISHGFVQLKVFDILGKEVSVLVNQNLTPGSYSADFNASSLPSGTYFYRITARAFTETKKMILIK
jgi:photosystem II stability/assembly factor-like uncharacterized protein